MAEESKPWENDPDGGSFGSWLRRQREVREISLREISQASKISVRYLEAIEQDREGVLPAPVFVRGFLREYARYVGLDPDEVINFHMSSLPATAEEIPTSDNPPGVSIAEPNRSVGWLVAVVAVVLASAALLYWWSQGRSEEAPPIVAPQSAPPPPQPTVEQAEVQAPLRLALDFTQTSWVTAYVDGERTVSELRVQGESLRIEAEDEIRLTLGNVAGVAFELNGDQIELDARDDQEVVIDRSLVDSGDSGGAAE